MSRQIDRTLDFVTRLRTGKRSLRLLLTGITREDLERFHFADGQEVRVRIVDDRLEIRPRRLVHDIQLGLGRLAAQFREMAGQLGGFRRQLPDLSGENGEVELTSVEAELAASIECVLIDDLAPAIARLESASRLSSDPPGDFR